MVTSSPNPSSIRLLREAVERSLKFAYTGRKQKKRQYRALWIVRINAACRNNGMSYSTFINGLKLAGNGLDRKILADIAANDAAGFAALAVQAKSALKTAADKRAKTAKARIRHNRTGERGAASVAPSSCRRVGTISGHLRLRMPEKYNRVT